MEKCLYRNVMLIDDSQIDRFVSTTVIKHSNFAEKIIECSSASAALEHLQTLRHSVTDLPSVIFLDINMPIMSGFDFLDSYLQLPPEMRKHITVVMLSSSNASKDFERMKAYPVVRMFFHKPLTDKILQDIHRFQEKISIRTLFF